MSTVSFVGGDQSDENSIYDNRGLD